jgi:broad specificity phosphatase PhoE
MAPKIHLVRHAQGFHNLCQTNSNIHDPLLTPRGKEQCTELQTNFPYHAGVDLIVSSPIRRTLYTSLMSFEHDIKTKGLTIIAFPEVQETSDLPCDTGSSPEELAQEFAGKPIDLSLVTHGWNVKTGRWSLAKEAIAQRALEAREWLLRRPESEIVVVTHGNSRSLLRCCSHCCHCCNT